MNDDFDLWSSLINYDPDTGLCTWRISPGRAIALGSVAGGRDTPGYITIRYKGRGYAAHRIAWLLQTGEWPVCQVDHKNQVKTDNRWSNLRAANASQNKQNITKPNANNCSGYLGVNWHAQAGKWVARIGVNGKNISLGLFWSPQEASKAYLAAKQIHHEAALV